MSNAQKIIKYLAIAFAMFLAFTIVSIILNGSFIIISSFGLIHQNNNTVLEDLQLISNEFNKISSLDIDLVNTNLRIKTSNEFQLLTNNSKIVYTNNNGNVKIKDKNFNWLNNSKNSLVIYIPKDIILDKVNIETGAGKINIENLSTFDLSLELGAGDLYIENLFVKNNTIIDGGIGKSELNFSEINNLEADLGIGEFIFNGKLTGTNEIDSGIGKLSLNLIDSQDNYTFDIDKGIGSVILNNQKLETDNSLGTGANYLSIDGGIGEIQIDFNN